MELTPYVDALRRDLANALAVGSDEIRRAGDILSGALSASVRLVLLDALSAAATEITAALPDATVELRLDGGEPTFVVTPVEPAPAPPPPPSSLGDEIDDAISRISLRLPETLKAAAESAAAAAGTSLNGWLGAAVADALDQKRQGRAGSSRRPGNRITGWTQS